MKIIQSGLTDVGLKRKVNQDSIFIKVSEDGETCICLVADGMGGHSNGEMASKIIKEYVEEWWNEFDKESFDNNFSEMISSIQDKIYAANKKIYDEYNQDGDICGSTCILVFIHNGIYGVINAGDSHAYLKRGFFIKSLMIDDVWENQSMIKSLYTERQRKKHENHGKLVNAIGTLENTSLSVKTAPVKKNDTFLVCSDGLYKYCPMKHIKKAIRHVKEDNIEEYVNYLKEETYKAGAKDNISIILVKVV